MKKCYPFAVLTLLFLVVGNIAGCKSTNPLKSAQVYCMEIERDTYGECLKHRRAYLDERQKVIAQFREHKQNCEDYAVRKSAGTENSCVRRDHMVKAGGG